MSQKIYSDLDVKGSVTISTINSATTDTDKFLVSDGGVVKYRTGAEMLSDLGVAPGVASNIQHQVKAGVAINKGQAVYVTSADGTNMIVGLASNASEATSSKTMGLMTSTVAINGFGNVVAEGLLAGLNTSTATAGDPVWLSTGGNLIYGLINKPYAPAHLVFIGIVTRSNISNGEIFVKVQNGFELDEIHNVDLKTTTPINGHLLGFDGTLWVNKTIAGWLGYTPANANGTTNYLSKFTGSTTLGNSQIFDNGTKVGINTITPTSQLTVQTSLSGPISYDSRAAVYGNNTSTDTVYANSVGVAGRVLTSGGMAIHGDATTGGGWAGYFSGKGYFSGTVTSDTDFRAPIFYDSNNTAYYLDQASNSNLLTLSLNGAAASSEASLTIGAHGVDEGGQIILNKATSWTYAGHIDVWKDQLRFLYGTNTSTTGVAMSVSLASNQLTLPAYTSATSFTGTAVANLAVDASGNVITIATGGGSSGVSSITAGTGVTVSSSTGAVTISIGQSVATSATPSFDQIFTTNNGNGTNVKIGDDAWIGDYNAVNSIKIKGQQDATAGYISFGSGTESLGRTGTGMLTWGGSTVWNAANDGSGSGLDADLLDGLHASSFASSSHTHTFDSLTSKTGGTGTYTTSGDFRAPIFYDLDNTAYYLNPNGSSNLYNVTANSFIKSGGTATQFLKADGSVDSNTYLTSVTNISGYSGTLIAEDNRVISPSELAANRLKFGFTAWNNNNAGPYADFLHLRSYQDSSGGLDNLVMFRKDAIGMRIWQQTYGSATAYSSYKDIAFTDGTNATGTWPISITGNSNYSTNAGTANYAYNAGNSDTWGGYYLPTISNWNSYSSQDIVVGQLGWRNYGNSYTIFDASAALAPDNATTISQIDSTYSWTAGLPTLMGWDGYNTYGVRVDSSKVSDTSNYSNSSGSVDFDNITTKIGGTGTYQTSGDFRAPIFYDSNNTAYYLDPASTSNLNLVSATNYTFTGASSGAIGLVTSTSAIKTLSGDGTTYGYGISTNVSGGLDIMANQSGQPIRFWAGTTNVTPIQRMIISAGDVTASSSFRAPIFYDSNDTNYYIDPNSISVIDRLRYTRAIDITGTNLDDYTNAGFYNGSSMTNAPNSGWFWVTVERYTADAGWVHQTATSFGSGNTANIVYTRTKTGGVWQSWKQLMDTAGTSASGTWGISITGNAGTATTLQTARTINGTSFNGSANIETSYWGATRTLTIGNTGKTVNGSGNQSWTLSEIGAASSTHTHDLVRYSLAAPAFIDTLTTANFRTTLFGSTTNGYQMSTARWNNVPGPLTGLNQYGTMFAWAGSDTQGFIAMDYSAAALIVGGGNADNINWSRRVLVEQSWTNSKYFDTGGEIYGTRFYDANNSAYYVDPADTTTSANLASKIVIQSSSDTIGLQFANTYGNPSVGVYYGSVYTTSSFYAGSPAGTAQDVLGNGARFNIFYERSNTAYYIDPASTSVLNRLSISFNDATYQSGITVTNTNTGAQAIAGLSMFSGAHNGSINMFSSGYMDILNQNTTNGGIQFRPRATASFHIDNVSSTSRITIGSTNTGSHPLRVTQQVSNISIYADYDIVAYSDQSVKENVRPIENVLERINNSRGVLYDRIDSGEKDNIGFIAQELEVEFPELVVTNEDNTKAVKYQNAVAVLFEAVKEQQKQIEELKELVNKLITK